MKRTGLYRWLWSPLFFRILLYLSSFFPPSFSITPTPRSPLLQSNHELLFVFFRSSSGSTSSSQGSPVTLKCRLLLRFLRPLWFFSLSLSFLSSSSSLVPNSLPPFCGKLAFFGNISSFGNIFLFWGFFSSFLRNP